MNVEPISDIKACVFDAYGTLFDFAAAVRRCENELGSNLHALTTLWRDKQLQYSWLLCAQGRHIDFLTLTGDALNFALETLAIDTPGLRGRLLDCAMTPSVFADIPDVLRRLIEVGFRLAILSNGSPAMLRSAVAAAGLNGVFETVLSVEEVGAFKPHPKVYQLALDRLNLDPSAIAFVSSNAWDAHAASAFGLPTVWCNRGNQRRERLPGRRDLEIVSLTPLPDLLSRP